MGTILRGESNFLLQYNFSLKGLKNHHTEVKYQEKQEKKIIRKGL